MITQETSGKSAASTKSHVFANGDRMPLLGYGTWKSDPGDTRKAVRDMIEPFGGFILIHVATPIEVCEQRDRKGLYAKARAGILKEFTGISDPYEVPEKADIVINTGELSAEESAQEIILYLEREGYIGANDEKQT